MVHTININIKKKYSLGLRSPVPYCRKSLTKCATSVVGSTCNIFRPERGTE